MMFVFSHYSFIIFKEPKQLSKLLLAIRKLHQFLYHLLYTTIFSIIWFNIETRLYFFYVFFSTNLVFNFDKLILFYFFHNIIILINLWWYSGWMIYDRT